MIPLICLSIGKLVDYYFAQGDFKSKIKESCTTQLVQVKMAVLEVLPKTVCSPRNEPREAQRARNELGRFDQHCYQSLLNEINENLRGKFEKNRSGSKTKTIIAIYEAEELQ